MSDLFDWKRGQRSSFDLTTDHGVYALFLRPNANLPGLSSGDHGLVYVGLAANAKGLKGRCHFDARTRNHSPRKSLAVLLMDELSLIPTLITKANSSNTWGLDVDSDSRLSAWMHSNLDLAVEITTRPREREAELLHRYQPPLNLTGCSQSAQHKTISAKRSKVMSQLSKASGLEHSIA